MSFKYSYILPILCAVWFYATFIISYVISVCKKDVTPDFPYISDTGAWSPESCIFGLMLNTGALIQASIMYIRYRQVKYITEKSSDFPPSIQKYNKIFLYLGYFAAFGVCIVGNFQETNVLAVHMAGALLAFGVGSLYECVQTRISFQLYPTIGNKGINYLRVFCSAISSVMFLITFGFGQAALQEYEGDDVTKWSKDDGGYVHHFVSTVSEWIMAVATILFLLLYYPEFKKISFDEPAIKEVV